MATTGNFMRIHYFLNHVGQLSDSIKFKLNTSLSFTVKQMLPVLYHICKLF